MIYDYVIIGGGIAGVYFAYKMINTNPDYKILLLESTSRFGGRIHTKSIDINSDKIIYDAGAGRFFKSHKLLIKLIKELDLSVNTKTIPNADIEFISKNKRSYLHVSDYMTDLRNQIKEAENKLNEGEKNKIYNDLLQKNLYEVMISYLGQTKADEFKEMYVYYSDLMDCNAISGMSFVDEMIDEEFYVLKDGMSQIVDTMIDKIKNKIEFKLDCNVIYINLESSAKIIVGTEHGEEYLTKNVVLACPKNSIKKLHLNRIDSTHQFKLHNMLDMVNNVPLSRFFCIYPQNSHNKIWFEGMHKFTTSDPIKFVIPMDSKNGFIQISYVNSINAMIMRAIHERGDLKSFLEEYFKDLFPDKEIPPINRIIVEYCNVGIHHWAKGYLGQSHYKQMIKPFDEYNMFIIGEAYSLKQGWSEGALETSQSLIDKLNLVI